MLIPDGPERNMYSSLAAANASKVLEAGALA
jgi:hypothetical protein